MARKQSKAALEVSNRELEAKNTQLVQVLLDVVTERRPDARAFYELPDGDSVTFKMFRTLGAVAGIVLECRHGAGGDEAIVVVTLDDLIASRPDLIRLGGDHTERACAIDKLEAARGAIFDGELHQTIFDGGPALPRGPWVLAVDAEINAECDGEIAPAFANRLTRIKTHVCGECDADVETLTDVDTH